VVGPLVNAADASVSSGNQAMTPNETFWIAILATIPAILTALAGLVVALRNIRAVQDNVDKVHQIVNSQRSQMQREINALKDAIQERHLADVQGDTEKGKQITKIASELKQQSMPPDHP
jgi:hypothetical protein